MLLLRRIVPLVLTCTLALPAVSQPASGSIETIFAAAAETSTVPVNHSEWDSLLKAYVRPAENGLNRLNYKGFKAEAHGRLKAYVRSLESVARLSRADQFAFWANLYNSKTIDIVLDHYPVASIRDINLGGGLFAALTGGPWKAKVVTVSGQRLSLDDIEHTIMRGIFKDHRVHFAVNCASVGCPNLAGEAFVGSRLDAQLEQGGRAFVNSTRGVTVTGKVVTASKIFSWFKDDFGGTDASILEHIRRYADSGLKGGLDGATRISDYYYDWSLNDAKD